MNTSTRNNLSYSFKEKGDSISQYVNYTDLLKDVDAAANKKTTDTNFFHLMDSYVAQELDYNENYTKKQLDRIADYYEISKRKKKKAQLIEAIVLFENAEENHDIVSRRCILWEYVQEIKQDKYLSKFLILD